MPPYSPYIVYYRVSDPDPDPGGSGIFSPLGSGSRGGKNDEFCYNNWGLSSGMKKILRQFTKNCILMAEVTSFKGIFEYMYIKNANVFFITGILMMILTFRDELGID